MKFPKHFFIALLLPVLLGTFALPICGQSSDQSLPTPVLTNEINGRIVALDLGDARLTRHFYAFEGAPGDLLITIDGRNLNGDIDVFTAITFRPLMKTTLYANSQSGEVTKGLYLRTRQILILRVEARTPNDEPGAYHVRFGGTFAPFSGGIPVAENTGPADDSAQANQDSRRLSSVGATIPRPVVEKPAVVEPPKETAESEKPAIEKEKTTPPITGKARPTRPSAPRNSRGRARPTARPKPVPADTEKAKTAESKTDDAAKQTTAGEEKSGTPAPAKSEAKPQELPIVGAHLIIESKDGTKIDRPMSTVRRVVVEGGIIVVVLKTGRTERIPLSGVARMAIEP